MKNILTIACLITSLLVFSQSVADEIRWGREARGEAGDEEWGSRVRNLVNQLNSVPMEELSPEHLPEGYEERVIAELWRREGYPKLVKMGDEEAMEAYAQALIRTEARYVRASQTIASTYSPSFIKHLGPLLFHDEFFGQREVGPGRGRFDYGFTMTIVNGITALIAQSPEFEDDVRKWAENGFFQRKYLPDPVSHIRCRGSLKTSHLGSNQNQPP